MNSQGAAGISQKIEGTVAGLVRFIGKLFRTHWLIFRHPIRFARIVSDGAILTDDVVAPYTYLTFGGFIFTVAISAVPSGATEAFNSGIWVFEDIVEAIQTRWGEAISLTTLLLASFPVLLTVCLLSNIYARALYPKEHRAAFMDLSAYAFGFAAFFYFLVYILSAFGFLLSHFDLDAEWFEESWAFLPLTLGALLIVPIVSLASPLLFLFLSVRTFEGKGPVWRAYRVWLSPVYFILVFQLSSLAASVPGAFSSYQKTKLPAKEIVSDLVNIPTLQLRNDWQQTMSGHLTFDVLINNRTEEVYVGEVSGMWTTLSFGNAGPSIRIQHPSAKFSTGTTQEVVILEPGTAEMLSFAMAIDLEHEFMSGLTRMVELHGSESWINNQDFSVPYSKLTLHFDPQIAGDRVVSDAQVVVETK